MLFSCPNRRTNILRNMNRKQVVHIMLFLQYHTCKLLSCILSSLAGRFVQGKHAIAVKLSSAFFKKNPKIDISVLW